MIETLIQLVQALSLPELVLGSLFIVKSMPLLKTLLEARIEQRAPVYQGGTQVNIVSMGRILSPKDAKRNRLI